MSTSIRARIDRQADLASQSVEVLIDYHHAKAHAVQSSVAYELQQNPTSATGKHLRTGVNVVMAEFGGLACLLIAKGVITEREYLAAIAEGLENEVALAEERLRRTGLNVRFG